MNLSNVDLNLFLVLHTVLAEGSATRAAKRLHVTQSAVSNALARLRRLLDDPLLIRTARGLVPTPRALALAPVVAAAIAQLETVVAHEARFEPASSTRRFTIACTDYEEVVLLPAIIEQAARRLPRATLRVVTIDYLIAGDGLASGDIDAMVAMPPSVPPGCVAEELFTDDAVCVVRGGHPLAGGSPDAPLPLADLASRPHIDTAILGESHRALDQVLAAAGLSRSIGLSLPHFTVAALAVARTDYFLPFPRRMAQALAGPLGLQQLRVPALEALPRIAISLVWHARSDPDPGAGFFRGLIRDAAQALPAVSGGADEAAAAPAVPRRRKSKATPAPVKGRRRG
jgi:DNA-binding transcriptional LysR family regulator